MNCYSRLITGILSRIMKQQENYKENFSASRILEGFELPKLMKTFKHADSIIIEFIIAL